MIASRVCEQNQLVLHAVALHLSACRRKKAGTRLLKAHPRRRRRKTIAQIHDELGPIYFCRAYRMTYDSFLKLSSLLKDGIEEARKRNKNAGGTTPCITDGRKNNKAPVPNGRIDTTIRLACAIRYFAGGSPYDIQCTAGVSNSEVLDSVWYVVEAINQLDDFNIHYPADELSQRRIADEFCSKSDVKMPSCAGAIDGILVWVHKPSLKDAKKSGLGQKKFFCGRKHKFGLNCQAVSDARGRILDISIKYGGASSDLLAFEASSLYNKLEDGLLAEDLTLFGDNAYVNKPYMCTPYPNVSSGPKDDYNFFQSQLRIRVECAFGMLVHRWAILKSAMPHGITI